MTGSHSTHLLLAATLAMHASCAAGSDVRRATVRSEPAPEHPARPERCDEVQPGEPLQARVDATPEGGALCMAPGRHRGPLRIDRTIAVWGAPGAVVESTGVGTTVEITAGGARLAGVTVDGSGARYDTEDAAVKVRQVDGVRVEGLRIVNAVFGILSHQTNGIVIRHNEVVGDRDTARGMRGDAIRLWETRGGTIEGNVVRHSRDIVIWYSPGNRVAHNTVEHGRYGTHFMYSSDNEVAHNVYRSNAVGIFVMYSRNIDIHHNQLLDADGPSGMGLGLKESGNVSFRDNVIVHNAMGIYLDTSPLYIGDEDRFSRNRLQLNDTAVVFHGRASGNRLEDNDFGANRELLAVEGGGDALEATFLGNRYDDYVGYDLDGDGAGDVPHELRSLSNELTATHPNLAFFRGTPALSVVEAIGRIVPLFEPTTLMRDPQPVLFDPTGREAP